MTVADDDIRWRVERQFSAIVDRLGDREASAEDSRWATPRPGSPLAHDDSRTTYDPVSFQTHFFLTVAQDHLSTIREIVEGPVGIPSVALYTLARSAIESAAYGIWILKGGNHAKRVKRSLQLSYDAQRSVAVIVAATGSAYDAESVYAELEQNKRSVKSIPLGADLAKLPAISTILADVDLDLRIEPATALEAWRICSGMTHANRWVLSSLSELADVPGGSPGQRRIEASVAVLATVLKAAVELRDRLRWRIANAGESRLN
ncbi:hypothetical protein [Microbacterium sp. A1-JK]|uniref:hypothetical protein n=1 Tax=Microbacterium sp. A1-JK TaxID=3177516 RepID=UPI003886A848